MTSFSLTQAAKEVGKSKPTLSKAIKTGRMTASRVGNGYQIDAAELFRVYPKLEETFDVRKTDGATRVAVLEAETAMLRQQLEREQENVADLRARLDRSEDRITALLADQRAPEPRRRWWQRK